MSSFFSKSYVWTFDSLTCLFFTGSLRLIFKVLLFFYYLSFKIILFGFREKKIRLRKQACYSLNLCLNFDPLSLKTNIFRLGGHHRIILPLYWIPNSSSGAPSGQTHIHVLPPPEFQHIYPFIPASFALLLTLAVWYPVQTEAPHQQRDCFRVGSALSSVGCGFPLFQGGDAWSCVLLSDAHTWAGRSRQVSLSLLLSPADWHYYFFLYCLPHTNTHTDNAYMLNIIIIHFIS